MEARADSTTTPFLDPERVQRVRLTLAECFRWQSGVGEEDTMIPGTPMVAVYHDPEGRLTPYPERPWKVHVVNLKVFAPPSERTHAILPVRGEKTRPYVTGSGYKTLAEIRELLRTLGSDRDTDQVYSERPGFAAANSTMKRLYRQVLERFDSHFTEEN